MELLSKLPSSSFVYTSPLSDTSPVSRPSPTISVKISNRTKSASSTTKPTSTSPLSQKRGIRRVTIKPEEPFQPSKLHFSAPNSRPSTTNSATTTRSKKVDLSDYRSIVQRNTLASDSFPKQQKEKTKSKSLSALVKLREQLVHLDNIEREESNDLWLQNEYFKVYQRIWNEIIEDETNAYSDILKLIKEAYETDCTVLNHQREKENYYRMKKELIISFRTMEELKNETMQRASLIEELKNENTHLKQRLAYTKYKADAFEKLVKEIKDDKVVYHAKELFKKIEQSELNIRSFKYDASKRKKNQSKENEEEEEEIVEDDEEEDETNMTFIDMNSQGMEMNEEGITQKKKVLKLETAITKAKIKQHELIRKLSLFKLGTGLMNSGEFDTKALIIDDDENNTATNLDTPKAADNSDEEEEDEEEEEEDDLEEEIVPKYDTFRKPNIREQFLQKAKNIQISSPTNSDEERMY